MADVLAGLDVPWRIVAGWAIELYLGEPTRPHGDLELEVPSADYPRVRDHLSPLLRLHAVGSGRIDAGGVHAPDQHQTWGLDVEASRWRVDVMLVPGDAETWVYRRDESLTAPAPWMIDRTEDGIPYLRPHGTLLYKALGGGGVRPKDHTDFELCLPRMRADERQWLLDALTRQRSDHQWVGALRASLD